MSQEGLFCDTSGRSPQLYARKYFTAFGYGEFNGRDAHATAPISHEILGVVGANSGVNSAHRVSVVSETKVR